MMRRASRLLLIVIAALVAVTGLTTPAVADPYTSPSADPNSADYNPTAWVSKWGPRGATPPSGDITSKLTAIGLLSSSAPAQAAALTPDDITALTDAWDNKNLFGTVATSANLWFARGLATGADLPLWSPSDSDSAAVSLGAANYSALSPGLKSVVHQIALIVTGQNKPAMPDDAWASWMTPEQRAAYDAQPSSRFDWTKAKVTDVPGGSSSINCAPTDAVCLATKAGAGAAGTAAGAIEFINDPFGWIGAKMAAGAAGMWGWIAGLANAGTAPDLSVDWWIDAYKKAMAIGIILALLILLYQFSLVSRGKIAGRDLVETILSYWPAYVAGIVFGPALGQFVIRGSTTLTDGILAVFDGFSASKTDETMKAAFDAAGSGKAIGGIFVGIFVLIFTVIGVVVLFCSLALQLVAIYLSAAFFPIGFAWVLSVKHRGGSYKIPFLFLALLFARPAMFFLLGIGLAWLGKAMSFSDEGAQNLANLLAAVAVILIAAFAPFLLLKHAPVSPAGWSTPGGSGSAGGALGAAAGAGSMLTSFANRRASRQGSSAPAKSGGRAEGGAAGGGSAGGALVAGSSGPAGGSGPSGAQRAVAAGASGPGTARPAGLQRRSAAPGGPPSAAGMRVGQAAGGQPAAAAASSVGSPAGGSPVGKPAAGGRPAPSRPGGSSGPGGASAPSAAPAGASRGGGSVGGGSARGGGSAGGGPGSAPRRPLSGSGRRVAPGSNLSARRLVEGADGDQRWDSLS